MRYSDNPPFLMISSSGPADYHHSNLFGLYRKTEKMSEGRSVYVQEHDPQQKGIDNVFSELSLDSPKEVELFSDNGVWVIKNYRIDCDGALLRTATSSQSPASVKWQYMETRYGKVAWEDDQELTVTSLDEKQPSECEVTISLSEDIISEFTDPRVAGVYRADGSYLWGRPVLKHSEGGFTLQTSSEKPYGHIMWSGQPKMFLDDVSWKLIDDEGEPFFVLSGSAPSLCPADPRSRTNGQRYNLYTPKLKKELGIWTMVGPVRSQESSGITLKCSKHSY